MQADYAEIALTGGVVLDLKAGDVVVVSHPMALSRKAKDALLEGPMHVLPRGVNAIVLEEGAGVSVLRPVNAS